jgi:hypothetical protein
MWRGFRRSAISILTSGKEFAVSDIVGPSPPLSLGPARGGQIIACVDDQRSVITDRLIVDRRGRLPRRQHRIRRGSSPAPGVSCVGTQIMMASQTASSTNPQWRGSARPARAVDVTASSKIGRCSGSRPSGFRFRSRKPGTRRVRSQPTAATRHSQRDHAEMRGAPRNPVQKTVICRS